MMKNLIIIFFILLSFSCKEKDSTTLTKLTNNNLKYWLYISNYTGYNKEYNSENLYILCLNKNGSCDNYYKGNLCAPIYKQKEDDEKENIWKLLNDTTITIGYKSYKIESLSDETMILSIGVTPEIRYYALYIKAPKELITNDKICNLEFIRSIETEGSSDTIKPM